jgi:hypothetical protein
MKLRIFLTPLRGPKHLTTSGNIFLLFWLEASVPIVKKLLHFAESINTSIKSCTLLGAEYFSQ